MRINDSYKKGMQRIVNWLMSLRADYDPFRKWEEIQTPHGLLALFNALGGDVIEILFFMGVAWTKWRRYSCPANVPLKQWILCSWQAVLPGLMVVVIGLVFHLSRRSANAELIISEKLFPEGRMPKHWIGRRDAEGITISVIAFFALYIGLAVFADHAWIVALFMFAVACIDLNTRRLINARGGAYLDEEKYPDYAPLREDHDCDLIHARRRIVQRDLFEKPHAFKEKFRVAGCACALDLALFGERNFSYVVLILTLIVNEIVTWRWRKERDCALRESDRNKAAPLNNRSVEKEKRQAPGEPFSLLAWLVSFLYMGVAAWVARKEGTFSPQSVTLGFAKHGGMWGDLVILPVVNGLIVPYLLRLTAKRALAASVLLTMATAFTLCAHWYWAHAGKTQGITDFVFPSHNSVWYNDLSASGYLHVIYMSLELALILIYLLIPLPPGRVLWITGLLTLHLVFGQVQPAWYATHKIWTAGTMVPIISTVLLTWLTGGFKVWLEKRRVRLGHSNASE
jgi:hypothetical protein